MGQLPVLMSFILVSHLAMVRMYYSWEAVVVLLLLNIHCLGVRNTLKGYFDNKMLCLVY